MKLFRVEAVIGGHIRSLLVWADHDDAAEDKLRIVASIIEHKEKHLVLLEQPFIREVRKVVKPYDVWFASEA